MLSCIKNILTWIISTSQVHLIFLLEEVAINMSTLVELIDFVLADRFLAFFSFHKNCNYFSTSWIRVHSSLFGAHTSEIVSSLRSLNVMKIYDSRLFKAFNLSGGFMKNI
ncbi:hypothetical protein CsSME_00001046 [Camellia sinensis var. sinensis]